MRRKSIMRRAAGIAAAGAAAIGAYDLVQKRNAVLRNYPVVGHARGLLLGIRPQIQQYFIERDWDGRPFDRMTRELIDDRAEGAKSEEAFGTLRDVEKEGAEWLVHSMAPLEPPAEPPVVVLGGPECSKPAEIALMNVSAMSFGALSGNAVRALSEGAAAGGFAHDTGEGGISDYHRAGGAKLIWEIGTGYFGTRSEDGTFSEERFAEAVADDQIVAVLIKLSQGAKPGLGGVLPGAKVTAEIARIRGVPEGEKCVSPAQHSAFSTPAELIAFVRRLRELSGGKPIGFKMCVTSRRDVLAICRAMVEADSAPDFIVVDGSEGGTAAAPQEFEDSVGMPLTQGLATVHGALVASGLRDRIRVGASGKVASAADIVRRLIIGADYVNAARPMMIALGCIQSLRCASNTCPTGVATQNPRLERSLDVPTKAQRVTAYQRSTVIEATRLMASMGAASAADLTPEMLRRNLGEGRSLSYAELIEWPAPGSLLDGTAPADWQEEWELATSSRFGF